MPPRDTNKGEKIVGGSSNANIHTCVKLPIIARLVDQRGVYCTDPALMRFCTDFGRELEVGT